MRVALLSDTHIKRTGSRHLNVKVYRTLERADLILHAGDVVVGEVLEDLERFAQVRAVRGNNDDELSALPERFEATFGGVMIAMIHDSGPSIGRRARLERLFPGAALIVFGHSHIPLVDKSRSGPVLLNPGSPTDKRRQAHFTMATCALIDGRVVRPRLQTVDV